MGKQILAVLVALVLLIGVEQSAQAAAITDGDLVVLRVGDGTTTATGTGLPVTLDEYTVSYSGATPTAVTWVQSIAAPTATTGTAPTTGNRFLVQGGTAGGEGGLAYSTNGQYLTFSGYNTTVGAALNSGATTTEERVVGRIDKSTGVLDTTTAVQGFTGSTNGAAANRGAVSTNGTDIWMALSTGVRYVQGGVDNAGTGVNIDGTNNARRNVVYKGQLYESEAATSRSGVEAVGTGTPTAAASASMALLPGFSTVNGTYSPYDYFFANDTTLYFADDSTAANKGLDKFVFDGTNWVKVFSHPIVAEAGAGIKSLSGFVDGSGNVSMFASTTGANANFLVGLSDTLSNTNSALVGEAQLVSGANSAQFNATGALWNMRGVAILGQVPEPSSLSLLVVGAIGFCRRHKRKAA